VAHFTGTTNSQEAWRILRTSLLMPSDQKWLGTLKPLAGIVEGDFQKWPAVPNAWGIIPLSLWKYRTGDYFAAGQWCRRALASPDKSSARDVSIHLILAMACFRLGHLEEARGELNQGRMMIQKQFPDGMLHGTSDKGAILWWDWIYARVLMREAVAMMGESPAPAGEMPGAAP
jgi:hypothetical protein